MQFASKELDQECSEINPLKHLLQTRIRLFEDDYVKQNTWQQLHSFLIIHLAFVFVILCFTVKYVSLS